MTYELSGDLIATAVCHCDHCQRQGGSAFSVNLIAHESQLTVRGELKTYDERGELGDQVYSSAVGGAARHGRLARTRVSCRRSGR